MKSLWPGIIDIDEAQAGGCPEFWSRYFPGEDPQWILYRCRLCPNWALFWDRICPAGQLRFVVTGVYEECERQIDDEAEDEVEDGYEYVSGEEGDFAVQVLEEVVKGRLVSDDPSFFIRSGLDLVLFWPFRQEMAP